MMCLESRPDTRTETPVDDTSPDLTPTCGPQCPVCGSGNTYTQTDDNMTTWTICLSCGARSC